MARTSWHEEHKVDLPEGKSGDWTVERFEIGEDNARLEAMREAFHPGGGARAAGAGRFTRLLFKGSVIMSDTRAEIRDHLTPISEAARRGGLVRIHGLGLGMYAEAVLKLPNVERVDVVELSPDVIALVGPTLAGRYGARFHLLQGDALALKPNGARYSVIWHDIWPTICADHWPEMKLLYRRWGRACEWQESWCRWWVRDLVRENKRSGW